MNFHTPALIPISQTQIRLQQVQTVNARELHKFLELKKDFSDWIKVQIERARLLEGRDFITIPQKGVGGKFDSIEYHLTLDAGKHISMMSNTEKGFQVRDYFIDCERRAKQPPAIIQDPQTRALVMLLTEQDKQKTQLEKHKTQLDYHKFHIETLYNELDGVNKAVGAIERQQVTGIKVPTNPITMKIHQQGLTVKKWAAKRGFNYLQVRNVISGLSQKIQILDAFKRDGIIPDTDLF